MSQEETKLAGGRTTAAVMRVGETIRRPPAPNAGFARSLLRHLEAAGFDGAPQYRGTDERGRETLTYIPGEVPVDLGDYDDETLRDAARLIRRYHDATVPLFKTKPAREAGIEVACHNDLSPCNTVFRNGHPVALIDFDAAAPGSRAFDLGYAAWLWLDVGEPSREPQEQVRRLRLFLSAYGPGPTEADVITNMLDRQAILIAEAERTGNIGLQDWSTNCRRWTLRHLSAVASQSAR